MVNTYAVSGGRSTAARADVVYELRDALDRTLDVIDDNITDCSIDVDHDKAVVATASFQMRNPMAFREDEDFIVPKITITPHDGRPVKGPYVMGRYRARRGELAWVATNEAGMQATGPLKLDDITGSLASETFGDVYTVPTGGRYDLYAATILKRLTLPGGVVLPVTFPPVTTTTTAPIDFEPDGNIRAAATSLLNRIGYYAPWASWSTGAMTTIPYRDFARVAPDAVYGGPPYGEILIDSETIRTNPDDSSVAAKLVVIQIDTNDEAKTFRVVVVPPAGSPILKKGSRTRTVKVTGYADLAAVIAYARELGSQMGTVYETGTFQTRIEPWHNAHELYFIDVTAFARSGDYNQRLNGRWRVTGMTHHLKTMRTTHRIARSIPYDVSYSGGL